VANSADVAALKAERSALIAELAAWRGLYAAAGSPVSGFTVSIDGESYDWAGWYAGKLAQIKDITSLLTNLSAPWTVRTR